MKPPAHIPHLIHSTTLTSALTSPRLFPRDLLRRKSTARPVGTSLNLNPSTGSGRRLNLNLNLNLNLKLFMYSIIQLFPNLPRSIRRDPPRCKAPARPAGTSLNLNLILNLILNLNLMSLVYSIIHVFYYSCILLFNYSPTSPARPTGTSLNLNLNLQSFAYSIIHVLCYSIIPSPQP